MGGEKCGTAWMLLCSRSGWSSIALREKEGISWLASCEKKLMVHGRGGIVGLVYKLIYWFILLLTYKFILTVQISIIGL